jgi:hypothetical protein
MSKTIDTGITENDLLAELAAAYQTAHRQPGDVDKWMFSAATGLSLNSAARVLREKAAKGELVEERVLENGKWILVYRRGIRK